MPAAAAIYGRGIIDTLHERMGGDAQRLGPGENGTYDGAPDGVWGRLIGQWGHRGGPGIYIGGPSFEGSWWKLGLGGTYDFTTSATFYGNVNYERTFDSDAYAWEGKLGLKVSW
jgi:hypothetical protein